MNTKKPWLKKFNLRKFRHSISLATLITIIVWTILYFSNFFTTNSDMISFLGFSATTSSIFIAVIQSINIHDWNRRHAATEALKEFREKTKKHQDKLNDAFNYFLRDENSPITKDEIHNAICKKGDNGKFLRDDTSNKLELDPEKRELTNSIREYLNLYESVASGVHQGIYDKEVVADLVASSIIKAANLFEPYIKHFNDDMYPSSQGRVWLNIKTLGKEFKERYRSDNTAEDRDKTG